MLIVILAGGKGTRILEETRLIPKALVRIGNKPIIEHQVIAKLAKLVRNSEPKQG